MYIIEKAENKDVDLLLDMKLDIIFNSEEISNLEKNDLEKIVNYTEEEIRDNLSNYNLILQDQLVLAAYSLVDYNDGKLIDTIYVKQDYRNKGVGSKIINKIIQTNYSPIYVWVYKSNEDAINLYKKFEFEIQEETDIKYFLKNENTKKENNTIKARLFCQEVEKLSKKYNLEYFFVTEGLSINNAQNCDAVKSAQTSYILWKSQNGEEDNNVFNADDNNFLI